jgi:hypothetical protein
MQPLDTANYWKLKNKMKDLTGENILKERTINCSDVCTNFAV